MIFATPHPEAHLMHADTLDANAADLWQRTHPLPPAAPPPRLIDLGDAAPEGARHVVVETDDDLVEALAGLALHYFALEGAATVERLTLHGFAEAEIRRLHPRWLARSGEIGLARLAARPGWRPRLRVLTGVVAGG
jgi:hypothetical protein